VLQAALVLTKSGRLELEDNICRILWAVQLCDIIDLQTYRIGCVNDTQRKNSTHSYKLLY